LAGSDSGGKAFRYNLSTDGTVNGLSGWNGMYMECIHMDAALIWSMHSIRHGGDELCPYANNFIDEELKD